MYRLLLLIVVSVCSLTVTAQQNHFIYIQTDNKQAFYVRVNEKYYSSSSTGYMIIPKLVNGTYSLSIGFPKNEWPLQVIPVVVNNNDQGFSLKNFGEKGWGLFNMQTMEVAMGGTVQRTGTPNTVTSTDGFSNVLADVVNSPSLKEIPAPTATKPEAKVEAKADPKPVVAEKPVTVPVTEPVVAVQTADQVKAPAISLVTSSLDADGRTAIYIDNSSGKADTVRVFIPYPAKAAELPAPTAVKQAEATVTPSPTVITEEKSPEKPVAETKPAATKDGKFLEMELPNPNTPAVSASAKEEKPAAKLTINSDCKAIATDADFLKARKKLAGEDNDDDMIAAARKIFKSKCFSTEQVRNLGLLFLKDDGRYRFFDAAYPYVHDTQHFSTLESQLTEEYYVTRFRAMLRH